MAERALALVLHDFDGGAGEEGDRGLDAVEIKNRGNQRGILFCFGVVLRVDADMLDLKVQHGADSRAGARRDGLKGVRTDILLFGEPGAAAGKDLLQGKVALQIFKRHAAGRHKAEILIRRRERF